MAAIAAAVATGALSRSDRGADGGGEAENTYGLPEGVELTAELLAWFRRQQQAVLDAVPQSPLAPVPDAGELFKPTDWDDPMARACVPYLSAVWDKSGKATVARLGLDPAAFEVTSPHLRGVIERAALAFCKSTNETTGKQIGTAVKQLRAELVTGLVDEGESIPELTKRIRGVFERATEGRAKRIAATESARAFHAAQEAGAQESGVVAGLELLLSGDACPLCRKVATEAKRVKLGQPFAVIGSHPDYSQIRHPPIHPNCQCTVIEVLTPEYGGPADPGFRPTLVQPTAGPTYTPPAGHTEPKPEPGRQGTTVGTPPAAKPRETPIVPHPAPSPHPSAHVHHAPPPPPPETPIVPNPGLDPRPVPGPKGTPVAAALDVRAKGKLGDDVRAALDTIGTVHGDGKLPTIPVRELKSGTAEGVFARRPGNVPLEIGVHGKGTRPRTTLAHEVGHFLDRAAIPGTDRRGDRDWEHDPLLSAWYHAVRNTDGFKRLKELEKDPHVLATVGNKQVRYKVSPAYVEYTLKPTELWARAYAQYIALRSGDGTMRAEIAQDTRGTTPTQWHEHDFEPVARAMDAVFHKLGWRA